MNYSRCTVYPAHKWNTRPPLTEIHRLSQFACGKPGLCHRPCAQLLTLSRSTTYDLRVSLGISTWLSTRNPLAWKQLCHAPAFPFPFADVPHVESLGSQRMALKGHALHEKAKGQIFVILPLQLMTKTFSLMKQYRCVPTSCTVTARAHHSLFLASRGQQFMQHAHPGLLGSSNVLPCAALTAVSCENDQLLKSGFRYTNLPVFAYTNSQMIQRNLCQTPLA